MQDLPKDNKLSMGRQIDVICDQFEEAAGNGKLPRIESYLDRVEESGRTALLIELLKLELELRCHDGETALLTEYTKRFPEDLQILREVFEWLAKSVTVNVKQTDVDETITFQSPATSNRGVGTTPATRDRAAPTIHSLQIVNDRYRLEAEIGRGGMGLVFRAKDLMLDRRVAIKVILADRHCQNMADPLKQALFLEEAKLGAKLSHPNIATVLDCGIFGDQPFTVFEYVEGRTLRDLIRNLAPLPLDEVQHLVRQLAEALDYAHSSGVIHRDLKPENVIVTEHGQVKVLDLGLAKRFLVNQDWSFAGTPAYASPEQIQERPSDGRTDQYALGLMVCELITGNRPFLANTIRETLQMHLTGVPSLPRSTPPDLAAAVLRTLSKEPGRRYDTCGGFALAIGCQKLPSSPPASHSLFEATVFVSVEQLNSQSSSTIRLKQYLCLDSHALWEAGDNAILRIPITAITSFSAEERLLRVTNRRQLEFPLTGGMPEDVEAHHIWECESVEDASQFENVLSGLWSTRDLSKAAYEQYKDTIALLRTGLSRQVEQLSKIEAESRKEWAGRMALQVAASRVDAAAIANFRAERVVGFRRSTVRCSGIAVRAVNDATRAEIALHIFQEGVSRASGVCIFSGLLSLLIAISFLFFNRQNPTLSESAFSAEYATVCYFWIFCVAVVFRLLRWPQLVRPLIIAVSAGTFDCLVVFIIMFPIVVLNVDIEAPPKECMMGAIALVGFFGLVELMPAARRCKLAFRDIKCEPDRKRRSISAVITLISWLALFAMLLRAGYILWNAF